MKNVIICLITLIMVCIPVFSAPLDGPAATVNLIKAEIITKKQLSQKVNDYEELRVKSGLPIPAQSEEQILDSMIAEILIVQAAERDGVTITNSQVDKSIKIEKDNVESQLKSSNQLKANQSLSDKQFQEILMQNMGDTWENIYGQYKQKLLQEKYVTEKKRSLFESMKSPSEEEIRKAYSTQAHRFTNPEYVGFKQIFINTVSLSDSDKGLAQKKADELYKKIKQGADFSSLIPVNNSSEKIKILLNDPVYLGRDDANALAYLGDKFVQNLFDMKVGEISNVIKSNIGYHVVKKLEHKLPKILQLNDQMSPTNPVTVREYLIRVIISQKQQQVLQQAVVEIIDELKKEAEINKF